MLRGPPILGWRWGGGGGGGGPEAAAAFCQLCAIIRFTRPLHCTAPTQNARPQVYMTLAVALALAAVGVYASAVTGYGQGLGMIGFLVSVPWMLATPANPANLRKRRALFGGAAVSQGLLLAPLVRATLALHPGVLFTAFGGTAGELPCRVERSWLNGSEDCLLLLCLSDSACPPGKRMPCCQHLGIPPTHLVMPPACPALPARVPAGVFACFSAAALLSPPPPIPLPGRPPLLCADQLHVDAAGHLGAWRRRRSLPG